MTGEYILKDGSCSKECPYPLTQRKEISMGTFCLNPCKSDKYFVSKNGSCLSSCPNYFETKIEYGSVKYCLNPCLDGQYYSDQKKSCQETCLDPFLRVKSEEGIDLCKSPCPKINDFIYDDQSCHENYPTPLKIEGGGTYCKNPCQKENEYVNKDGVCQERCEYPEKVIRKGPYQLCMIDEEIYLKIQRNGAREIIKISNILSKIGGIFGVLLDAGDPTSILMTPLLGIFEQITMIEVVLPVNIELTINGEKKMEKSLSENLDHNLQTIGVICIIYLLLVGIRISATSDRRSRVSQLLYSIWTVFVLKVISLSGNALLYLFWTDKFKDFQWNEIFEVPPRILICFFVILFTIFVIYKIIQVRKRRSQEQYVRLNASNYPERWRFLFEIYQSNGLFMLIYILRMAFVSFIIGCLSPYPQVQASLMGLVSVAMLLYLILGSPIAKKISYLQHLIIETALFLYNGVFVILVVFDLKDEDEKNISGRLMTTLYFTGSLITALIILLKLLKNIYHLLFKARDGLQADHIQLREFSQNSGGNEREINESFEQQPGGNEVNFREINQEGNNIFLRKINILDSDAEDDEIEANVVIE